MTTLLALILTALALAAIGYPLFARRGQTRLRSSGAALAEMEERYRSALADLQDLEADREIGNLSETDHGTLREQYRRRAAEVLREIDALHARETAVRVEFEREAARRRPSVSTGTLVAEPAKTQARGRSARLPVPVLVGTATAVLAIAGVVALYARAVSVQAAQSPLATLPIAHAHVVTNDETGGFWVGHHDGLLQSSDGRTWRQAGTAGDTMGVVATPDGAHWLALGHDVALVSTDLGASWSPLTHDLPGTDIHGAAAGRDWIYAYVVGFGVFRSGDGAQWVQTGVPIAQEVGALAVLSDGAGGDALFLAAGGTVLRSADGGRTWGAAAGAGNLALGGTVRGVAANPDGGALFAATTEGLYRSLSQGADWLRLPFRGSPAAVGAREARVAVVDQEGRFFLSTDGGATWVPSG
ncbi:MAG: hypothetical protein GEU73_04380 [Chloroflexi bacterium]|nr:hypothetical protein [Chloroflexota bacterium]